MGKTVKKTRESRPKSVKRPQRSLTAARVRKLALDHDEIAGADASLGRQWDLPRLLAAEPDLHAAWKRGQLLRDLRRLARNGSTRHEAAHDLRMTVEEFESLVSKDIEAAELWNRGKLETSIWLREKVLALAGEGRAQALKQVENVLRSEIAAATFNVHRVPEPLVCEIFGVTRQTLNIWHREKGCPRNGGETTYDLPALVRWFEGWVRAKAAAGSLPEVNPLQAVKAERLNLELAHRKGELVEVERVKAGLLARERALVAILEHKPEELASLLEGKTRQEIKPILAKFAEDLRREWVTHFESEMGGS
jgi:hypothetical protein